MGLEPDQARVLGDDVREAALARSHGVDGALKAGHDRADRVHAQPLQRGAVRVRHHAAGAQACAAPAATAAAVAAELRACSKWRSLRSRNTLDAPVDFFLRGLSR